MASSSPIPILNYEVFLSFRGEDTRKNFTDHLYTALVRARFTTFRVDDELQRGRDISSEVLKVIQESKISLVVFSKGYASSRWCLNELVKIIDCKKTLRRRQTVIPIFYDVDPSDVRKQRGSYGEAFAEHEECFPEDMEMIKQWRSALTEAADLSGWHLQNIADGHESKFIQKIVEDVFRKLNRVNYLNIATHPVAIKYRVDKVMELLSIGSDDVRIVGIYGLGGIGKTTVAKVVYNSVCDGFEESSFLSDIKDNSKQPNGLATIQQQLLSDILNSKKSIWINNVGRGMNLIQERLCNRRVFIVFDDMDDSTQLKSLVGSRSWFGPGTRIIVTTRDERLLTELEVDERYNVETLNFEESMELFSWHAFRRPTPKDDYLQLSKSVVNHVQGLPLALEVLGSSLFKRSQPEWKSVVEKLRQIPHHQIQKKLRISFDTLGDDQLKATFLDIACFFVGMDKEYVLAILDGCGFFPVNGVSVLLERSLIAIDPIDHKIKMHDLLRDMGREIVREMSPNQVGNRSRLWSHQDVVDVLRKHTGTEAVEGLILDVSPEDDAFAVVDLSPEDDSFVVVDVSPEDDAFAVETEAFAKMINLRLLKINSLHFSTGSYENISKQLSWLCWHRCPLQVLPPTLDLENLAVLDMRFSYVNKVWKETKFLYKLKILDLSYSVHLAETPNFTGLSSLKRLQLEGCTSLAKLHESIGNLKRLVFLNLAECNNLRELPGSICNLTSLETLNLNGCSKLESFPEHLGKLEALRKLLADGCDLTRLPLSLGHLKNLEHLSLAEYKDELPANKALFAFFSSWVSPKCGGSSTLLPAALFSHLRSLKKLNLGNRNLLDGDISVDFGNFPFLNTLDLAGNNFCSLPVGISNHSTLEFLTLDDCTNLQSIPELPPNLDSLSARQCTSITAYPKLSNTGWTFFNFILTNGGKMIEIDKWDFRTLSFPRSAFSWVDSEGRWSKTRYLEACIPATDVPDWFDYKETGSSLVFNMPSHSLPIGESPLHIILCVIFGPVSGDFNNSTSESDDSRFTILFKNNTKGHETFDKSYYSFIDVEITQDHAWVSCLKLKMSEDITAGEGDEIEVSVEARGRIIVKKCGIHLQSNSN